MRRVLQRVATPTNLLFLAALGLFVVWFVLLRPAVLDGPASYIMVSGRSMEPTLESGDLAMLRQQDTYGAGDVVAFKVGGGVVIHRIVGGTADEGFIVQGDNKDAPDLWRPLGEDILGRMWFSMPVAGRLLAFLQGPLPLAGLASGLGVFLVLSGDAEEKRPRKGSPGKPPNAARRRWRPPGLTLWLLLAVALMVRG